MTTYSNEKMRENLGKSIDEKKLQAMMELKRAYNAGEITLEEGRKRAKAELGTLEPYEFAVAEQGQQSLDPDECRKEDIQAMIDLFSDVLSTKRPELAGRSSALALLPRKRYAAGDPEGDRGSGAVPADQEPVA